MSSSENLEKELLFKSNNLSFPKAPSEAPPLKVRWFYATDIPKRRRHNVEAAVNTTKKVKAKGPEIKTAKKPTKFVPFSTNDSRRIETAFQQALETVSVETSIDVNEDMLFEVNLTLRELIPVYWDGPVYEVQRGTWFYQDGTSFKPCEESLSFQIEQAYIETRPWTEGFEVRDINAGHIHELTGMYASNTVLYKDAVSAYYKSSGFYGQMTTSVISTITNGAYGWGTRLIRGFQEKSFIAGLRSAQPLKDILEAKSFQTQTEQALEMQMEEDYTASNEQGSRRNVEHLILCVHGIGQKLGERLDTVNFVHHVNLLRRNFKETYQSSEALRQLRGEGTISTDTNCAVQVLPIVWRTAIEFGSGGLSHMSTEMDLSELDTSDSKMASLDDITIDGVGPVRTIISDVLLDILLYYQPAYREKMLEAVASEMNRVYHLFRLRNPNFNGTVSIFGHSLGSALTFDLLCQQPDQYIKGQKKLTLDFDVQHFYAVGSPIGMIQLIRGKSITSRAQISELKNDNTAFAPASPKCSELFNIFHPYDPIAYRLEPLVQRELSRLRPVQIPFVRATLSRQLSGVGQKLSDSASNMFTGYNEYLEHKVEADSQNMYIDIDQKTSNVMEPSTEKQTEKGDESLYSNFVKSWEPTAQNRRVYSLNFSGRIDYALQGSAFDTVIVSAFASHISYWSEPDVTHMIMSKLYDIENKKKMERVEK